MEFKKKFIYIPLILLVAGFEIYVFKKIFYPNVTELYRMYYIDKKLASWSHGEGILYIKGTTLDHRNIRKYISKKGWSGAEFTHRWTDGKVAKIYFKIKDTSNYRGMLSLKFGTHNKQRIKLTINDHNVANSVFNSESESPSFKFDPKIMHKNSVNIIQFELPDAHSPKNGDSRVLGIAFKAFTLD